MAWIVIELLLLNQPSWTPTEDIYFVIGAALVGLGVFHGW